jgi:hypothetical protein
VSEISNSSKKLMGFAQQQSLSVVLTIILVSQVAFSGCNTSSQPIVDRDPITPPSRTLPIDPSETLYGKPFEPHEAPPGQVYQEGWTLRPTENSVFKEAIERLTRKKLVPISEEGYFLPSRNLSRGEALLWLYNLYESVQPDSEPSNLTNENPSPVQNGLTQEIKQDGNWIERLKQCIEARQILTRYPEFLNDPDKPLKREELACLIWIFSNMAKGLGKEVNASRQELANPDSPETQGVFALLKPQYASSMHGITSEYLLGVQYLVKHKQGDLYRRIFLRDTLTTQMALEPQKNISREEAAALIDAVESDFHERVFINKNRAVGASTATSASPNPDERRRSPRASQAQTEPDEPSERPDSDESDSAP